MLARRGIFQVISQSIKLIYLILFILVIIFTLILLYQYSQPNKTQTRSNRTSEKDRFDTLCYDSHLRPNNQTCSLVEPQNGEKISSQLLSTDRRSIVIKGLINQIKDLSTYFMVLLKYRFLSLRKSLEEVQARNNMVLKLYHPQDKLQFINGLVLGQKAPEAAYLADFTNAGMLHVLVASGFNVALVASLAWWLVKSLPRKLQLKCMLMAIWLYVVFLEFQPPLLRAAWMFSIVFLLKFYGLRTKRSRILAWSVAIILFFQPELLQSLSLWLSALATLGILTFSRRISLFWSENSSFKPSSLFQRIYNTFLEEGAVSLSAQALIFPLLIWFFHSLNLVSLLANPLLLPWIGAITQLAGLEFLLTFLEKFWLVRLLIGAISWAINVVLALYFSAVAWWQHLSFLNQTTAGTLEKRYLAVWAGIIGILLVLTRRKSEVKTHFFHEKA